jgi:hypothetical protein
MTITKEGFFEIDFGRQERNQTRNNNRFSKRAEMAAGCEGPTRNRSKASSSISDRR